MARHRFLPRFRALALLTVCAGGLLFAYAFVGPSTMRAGAVIAGVLGLVLGAGYLLLPIWRYEVVTDERGLGVVASGRVRFDLPWSQVERVIAAPAHHTCFVDGGRPERSLLVPGVDAPASYDLADKTSLFRTIMERVPPDRITEVASMQEAER